MGTFKKLCGLAFAGVFLLSTGLNGYVKAADWHYRSGIISKGKCDNTYCHYDCGGIANTVTAYAHETSGGICYVYAEIRYHTLTCSSCGYAFIKNKESCCTTWHSICDIYNPDILTLEE